MFKAGTPWLSLSSVGLSATPTNVDEETQPPQVVPAQQVSGRYTFAEAGSVVRLVGRAAQTAGQMAGWPTFNADLRNMRAGGDPTGRTMVGGSQGYEAAFVAKSAPVQWQDVPGPTYGAQIP